jgi:hypothetical protein
MRCKVEAMNVPGIAESPRSARWGAVESLAAKTAQDMAAPQPNLPFILVCWRRQIEIFRDAENEKIIGVTPSADERQAHKQVLAILISQGEFLVAWLRENDVTNQVGLTHADIEATLEELYDRQRVFYGGMTEERRAQVLNEVFGAS